MIMKCYSFFLCPEVKLTCICSLQEEGSNWAMSSEETHRKHSSYREDYSSGQGLGQGLVPQTEHSTQEGMSTHPSVGRFTDQEQDNPLYSKRPSVGSTMAGEAQPMATRSSHGTLSQDQSQSSSGIVDLRATTQSAEGKVRIHLQLQSSWTVQSPALLFWQSVRTTSRQSPTTIKKKERKNKIEIHALPQQTWIYCSNSEKTLLNSIIKAILTWRNERVKQAKEDEHWVVFSWF